jgi:light-regulated signal transduction histidine kinase (bacteriophytochrome)
VEKILHESGSVAKEKTASFFFTSRTNGIGIDKQYGERAFQMFQRLHERGRYDGNGIGLAIAKKIVERHGGRIWFESEPGEGTTFYSLCQAHRETRDEKGHPHLAGRR